MERVLILWEGARVGPDDIGPLLDDAWPEGRYERVVISTYEVSPNLGMAQAMVFAMESKGELPPGAVERMRTVQVGERLVVLVESRRAPAVAGAVTVSRSDGSPLTGELESMARKLAKLVDAAGGQPFGWIAKARVRAIGAKANKRGGTELMRLVAERAAVVSTTRAALRTIDSTWDGIGDWRG